MTRGSPENKSLNEKRFHFLILTFNFNIIMNHFQFLLVALNITKKKNFPKPLLIKNKNQHFTNQVNQFSNKNVNSTP